jgi:hypothetical protein
VADLSNAADEVRRAADQGIADESSPEARTAIRVEALSLRLAGFTYAQIGERIHRSQQTAREIVLGALERAENNTVLQMRDVENARLDRLQMAVWSQAIDSKNDKQGEAIDRVLRISAARSRINGLYAPTQLQITMNIRKEMDEAFQELETLILEQDTYVMQQEIERPVELEGVTDVYVPVGASEPRIERELRPFEIPDPAAARDDEAGGIGGGGEGDNLPDSPDHESLPGKERDRDSPDAGDSSPGAGPRLRY